MIDMIEMKCDNDDDTINWERRANIVVLTSRLAGIPLEDVLEDIKDNPEFAEKVKERWKFYEEDH